MQARSPTGANACLARFARAALIFAALAAPASPAGAAVPHIVQRGETLWSIAASNNFTTRTVAAFNGLPENAIVVEGQTIQVPTVAEGAQALAAAGIVPGSGPTREMHVVAAGQTLSGIALDHGVTLAALAAHNGISTDSLVIEGATIRIPESSLSPDFDPSEIPPAPGMGHIASPVGELHLDPAAANAWNAMRSHAYWEHGTDIYPGGAMSAYRTREQQRYLYELYLAGDGALAAPPGSSSHESGRSVDLDTPPMRALIDQIGAGYGWANVNAPGEWWHVDYVGD